MHLYVHIPFCKKACHYCDFHFTTNLSKVDALVEALCLEIKNRKDYLPDRKLETIYFGGGTPSILSEHHFKQLFETLNRFFDLTQIKEVTIEANPDDVTQVKFEMLKYIGVNRISLGIQSFDDRLLNQYNRAHTSSHALESIGLLKSLGFTQLSLDLIYGFPAEDHSILMSDLDRFIKLDVSHISAYCLTVEPNTALGKWTRNKTYTPADDGFTSEQFELVYQRLSTAGFEAYEVSNFAQNQQYAVHNTAYWQGKPYLGIGPSAHSFNESQRSFNVANNAAYSKGIFNGTPVATVETLSSIDRANELIMTGLRTIWGVDISAVLQFCPDWYTLNLPEIEKLISHGHLISAKGRLVLTASGRLFADRISASLFTV